MTDRIALTGLKARGYHGALPEERRDGQLFLADVVLHTSIAAAAVSDDLGDTVDYATVASDVVGVLGGEPCHLIETVAERIAQVCLRYDGVTEVEVTVHKPHAPLDVPFDDVTVRIERTR